MNITEMKLPIKDLVIKYEEDEKTGKVVAWKGNLDVRPEYQREFVYDDKKCESVINTILNNFPLNIMYFVKREDGSYEVLDGQQRIISICRFYTNQFSVSRPMATGKLEDRNFPNLCNREKEIFNKYELQVYICEGTDEEKLNWFQTINIAGEKLEEQEIRNAIYHGKWLTDAKSMFSRKNCVANKRYGKYFSGDYIRQKFLETIFIWHADFEGIKGKNAITQYMQKHRFDENANDLWDYTETLFDWVENVFGEYNSTMKGVKWGLLYNAHKNDNLDTICIKHDIARLLADREVQKKHGIYEYLLTGDETVLNLRNFEESDKRTIYQQQKGRCNICNKQCEYDVMHGDHIVPWSKGGKTIIENCQMLCTSCNLQKGAKE